MGNGVDATEVITKYYAASFGKLSRLVALRKAGLLYFVGTDHLGSTIRVADAGFVAMDQMRYSPFGSSRDAGMNLKTDHTYTGQIEDQSIGWYWYRSRAYDPVLGRFLCPDSIVPEAGNPQALNRYAYTRNNPLRYSDPSGHDPLDSTWEAAFAAAHNGEAPTDQDRIDRLVSYLASYVTGQAWTDADWQRYTQMKEAGIIQPTDILAGTSGTFSEQIQLASALITLATSASYGLDLYYSFINSGGVVQFGGGDFLTVPIGGWVIGRQPGYSIGWLGTVYLEPSLKSQPAEIIAANIAHEAYHAKLPPRNPFSRAEEVYAFAQEARAWEGLRVTYKGTGDAGYDALVDAYRHGMLADYVGNQEIYKSLFYGP